MKGIIFNLLEEVVTRHHDAPMWDALLEVAHVDGSYTSLATYPDDELLALVTAACARLGLTADDLVRWFGREALPILAERYPEFFDRHRSTAPFLHTLNEIIHTEVRKLFSGADVPYFDLRSTGEPDTVVLGYASRRQLCALAEGFIEGAAAFYGESVSISQRACMKRGDDTCILWCAFSRLPPNELERAVEGR